MKLLFVASECAPFVKTGGLADVVGALPGALAAHGADVRVLLPAYPALADLAASGETVMAWDDLNGGAAALKSVQSQGINLLLLEAPHLFDRPGGIYLSGEGRDWDDNYLRFGALSRVGAEVAQGGIAGWSPDLVNAHDWQAGLVPAYLKQSGKPHPPVVITIHNIAFQGIFDPWVMGVLGISPEMFTPEGIEYYGRLSFLKAGVALADAVTTVSPTYARELMAPEFGMGLEGLMNARAGDLSGILNGIDTDVWNPETDEALVAQYSATKMAGKAKNRAEVEARFGLEPNPDAPLFCVISRLTSQKGLDMLLDCLPGLVGQGARLALLGSGDRDMESGFIQAASRFPALSG